MRFLAFIVATFLTWTASAEAGADRFRVPLRDAAVRGAADAKVTIVELADFQCPFSGRVQLTLQRLQEKHGRDLRIAFKHNPLPFHDKAFPAAEAALAAGEQGKFWEMHDQLFANQMELDRAHLEQYARDLGLDLKRFNAALNSHRYRAQIEADQAEATNFAARGTPSFFINGRALRGAQPFEEFEKVIAEELKAADDLLAKRMPGSALYDSLTRNGLTKGVEPVPPARPSVEKKTEARNVTNLGNSPQRGPADAKVTIVEFADFQCPFSARAAGTMNELLKAYPKDVRLVFKHQPLPFHPMAMPAAIASEAARHQDHFWEFHDRAFANGQALSPELFDNWIGGLGLDVDQYHQAINDPYTKATVEGDADYGTKLGANGTPTFFVNGRMVLGAIPFDQFKTVIDEEIKRATTLTEKGVRAPELYQRLVAENVARYDNSPRPVNPNEAVAVDPVVRVSLADAPVRGPNTALVTVVMWGDFQCPFCARAQATMKTLEQKYGKKIRFAFKHQPLPFHPEASLAAQAALAAGEQGKFWPMHDLLFANQKELQREHLEQYARQLHLDLGKFRRALDSGQFKARVKRDAAEGHAVGADGTPTFFINGRKLVGAQPVEEFEKLIDAGLANASALVAKGVKPQNVYETLMRSAEEPPAIVIPPDTDDDGEPMVDAEADVLEPLDLQARVDRIGDSPARGPENAKVTVVAWLDFASMESAASMAALRRLQSESPDLRLVIKHRPAPENHPQSLPASLAVEAARQQGKFWSFADLLLAHQADLSQQKFEQWARSLGLKRSVFRAAMKDEATAERVVADEIQGRATGAESSPTFLINGRRLNGEVSYATFRETIAEERAKADRLLQDGTPLD